MPYFLDNLYRAFFPSNNFLSLYYFFLFFQPNIGHDDFPVWFRCDDADSENSDFVFNESCTVIIDETPCDYRGQVRAKYFKGGIVFRLSARFQHGNLCGFPASQLPDLENTDFTLHFDGSWNKCGSDPAETDYGGTERFGVQFTHSLYHGTRRLKIFSLSTFAEYNCAAQRCIYYLNPSLNPRSKNN